MDSGAGVLFIVKNYSGDVMNFEMAAEMYVGDHASVLTNDDVAVEDSTYTTGPARSSRGLWSSRRLWGRRLKTVPISPPAGCWGNA